MTRAAHLNGEAPFLRAICLVVKSDRSNNDQPRQRAHGAIANFPRRPDADVLSRSILLFFIGRNRNGLWVAREAEGRTGGVFLLKQSRAKEKRAGRMRNDVSRRAHRSRHRKSRQSIGEMARCSAQ